MASGFEDLFTDPMAALGYSLLLPQDKNGNPMAAAASLMQQSGEAKRVRERLEKQDKLAELEMAYKVQKLSQPDLQFNPVTGEVYDMRVGSPYGAGGMTMPTSPAPTAGQDIPSPPPGLNPKEQMKWRERWMENMNPAPPKGFRSTSEGGVEPIPGGEEELQRKKAAHFKTETKRLIDDLLKDPESLRAITGTVDSMFPTILPGSAEAEVKLNQLAKMLTAENLNLMTGVLSESDIKMLQAISGGGLDLKRSDAGLIGELQRIQQQMNGTQGDPNANAAMQGGGYKAPAAGQIKFLGFE